MCSGISFQFIHYYDSGVVFTYKTNNANASVVATKLLYPSLLFYTKSFYN